MGTGSRGRVAVALVLLGVLAACSATSDERRGGQTAEPIATDAASATPAPDPGAPSASASASVARREGTGPRQASSAPGGPRTQGAGRAPKLGRGVTKTTIRFGIEIADRAATFGALGVGSEQGAREQYVRAVVDHLNATGGAAGRKIELVLHITSDTNGTFDAQGQAACTHFTEDTPVFAAGSMVSGGLPTLVSCMSGRGFPIVTEAQESYDDTDFRRNPHLYAPAKVSGTRWRVWIDDLHRAGYFRGGRIGLIRFDTAKGKRITDGVVKPALAAHGLRAVEEAVLTPPSSVAGLSSTAASASNAILRFQSQRVDRALFVATFGVAPFFWMPAAESQGYRPRYGMTSDEFLDFTKENVPAAQLRGARGIGWWPIRDVAGPQDPKGRPGEAPCRAAFKKAGLTFPDRLSEGYALGDCALLLFMKRTADRAFDLTPDGFAAAVKGFARSYPNTTTFGTDLTRRRDGANAFRSLAFADDCGCWRYLGGTRTVP